MHFKKELGKLNFEMKAILGFLVAMLFDRNNDIFLHENGCYFPGEKVCLALQMATVQHQIYTCSIITILQLQEKVFFYSIWNVLWPFNVCVLQPTFRGSVTLVG
jgi:hypothetical protein